MCKAENTITASAREKQVAEVLQTIIPAMEADGGGIETFFVQDNDVFVKLKGACLICPSVNLTLKLGLGATLRQHLAWVQEVKKIV